MKTFLMVLAGMLCNPIAHAGAWTSSGGELIKDSVNPWFVQNTKVIKYCIKVDEQHFSAPMDTIRDATVHAFEYWKDDFKKKVWATNQGNIRLDPAQQDFFEVPCEDAPDIAFQFGILTDAHQRKFIVNPKEYLGMAIRTEYDKANLKGRGFVYLSPDSGPDKYDGGPDTIEKAWQYKGLIFRTLVHELGHVFGIQHTGYTGGPTPDIMAASYPEYLVSERSSTKERTSYELASFFQKPVFELNDGYSCWSTPAEVPAAAIAYFGIPKGCDCISLQLTNRKLRVYVTKAPNEYPTPIFLGESVSVESKFVEWKSAVSMLLTSEEKVFPYPVKTPTLEIGGPVRSFEALRGTFRRTDGVERDFVLSNFSGDIPILSGGVDGKFYRNILDGW